MKAKCLTISLNQRKITKSLSGWTVNKLTCLSYHKEKQVDISQFFYKPKSLASPVLYYTLEAPSHWDLSWKETVKETRSKFTFSHTHPRLGCRVWWHRRRPCPAGWRPPPRSRRAWRGAGPGWCCRSKAAYECNPHTPSPCHTTWEQNRKYLK